MLAALRLPGFRWIAAVYGLDYLVELAAAVALMVLVYDATDSALAAALMLLCKQVVPGILTASLGSLLDRTTIRTGLALAYGFTAAVLAVLSIAGYGPHLFLLAVVAGTAGAAVRALLRTAVAHTTEGDDLRSANAFLNVVMGAVALLGPAAGALLVSQVAVTTALMVTAICTAALTIASLRLPAVFGSRVEDDDTEATDEPAARSHGVGSGALIVIGGLVFGLFAMDEPALLAYSRDTLHAGVGGYGAILVAWGVGMLIGSLVYGRLLRYSMPVLFVGGAALASLGYVGLGVAPTLGVACAVSVAGGAGNGVLWVALVTAVQESVPAALQARTAAKLEGVATATPAVGILIGGLAADVISPRASLLIPGAVACLALVVWSLIHLPARARQLPRATNTLPAKTAAGSAA